MAKQTMAMLVLLAASLLAAALLGQEPELTPEQEKLLKEAGKLNLEGVALYRLGKVPEAIEKLQQVLERCHRAFPKDKYPQGHPELAQILMNLATVIQAQREYGKAEYFYRQALEMNQMLYPQGHPQLIRSISSLGGLLWAQGEYTKAEPFFRQALQMKQKLYPREQYPQGHPDLAQSLNSLGALLQAQGEYGQAEPFLSQALQMNQQLYPRDKYPQGHPDLATSLNNLGALLKDQGEYGKAEPFYRQAHEMIQALYPHDKYPQGHFLLAASLNNLGSLFQAQEEHAKAEPLVRKALQIFQALYPQDKYPDGHPHLSVTLNNLGLLLQAQGEYGQAEHFLHQAVLMCQKLYPQGHPHLAGSINTLGLLFLAQGKYGQAETFYRRALEMTQKLYPRDQYLRGHPDLAISLYSLGALLSKQGEHGKAEPLTRQALEMFTAQANWLAQDAPEPVALNAAASFPLSRDSLLSATYHLPGSDARTYEAIWHSRAALTRVYQRRHLALIAAASDDAVRQSWDHLQTLRRQREQLIMAPTRQDPRDRQDKLRTLSKQIDNAEQELLPRLPVLKHLEELAKLGPDALRKLLPAEAVLIDFLRCTHFEQDPKQPGVKGEKRTVHYLAFVVSRQDVLRVELGTAAEIDEAVRAWREGITAKLPSGNEAARKEHEAKLARPAASLRRLLWEPIEKRLPKGVGTVYLAPDSALTQLPWAALPGKSKDRVLLDDYALAVLPHGPFLLEQLTPLPPRSAKRPAPAEGLLLVGGIHYDEKPSATTVASRGTEGVVEQKIVWDYLKGTDEERQLLTKVLQKTGPKLTANVSGTEAAATRLRQELERCRYAHVGTHGFFADKQFRSVLQLDPKLFERVEYAEGRIGQRIGEAARNPLVLSGLVCSGANRPETPERGILSADAIAGLLLDDLHLAVLSACDTGLGDVAGGEGVFGLQRAFHIAGCKNVVASLWKVDDAATAALMTRFYGHLFHEDKVQRLSPIEALRRAQLELYRHPELIPAWSKGEARAPGKPRPATTPAPADTPAELLTSEGRTPIRLWAAFTLSGLGR